MTTVDGGILTFKNLKYLDSAKKFRWFGMLKGVPRTSINIQSLGYKYNMNNVTAAIGLVQLDHISKILSRHISNGQYYDSQFQGITGIDYARCDKSSKPSYWLYTLLSENSDDIEKALQSMHLISGII